MTVHYSIRLSEALMQRLREISDTEGRTPAQTIRMLVEKRIAEDDHTKEAAANDFARLLDTVREEWDADNIELPDCRPLPYVVSSEDAPPLHIITARQMGWRYVPPTETEDGRHHWIYGSPPTSTV